MPTHYTPISSGTAVVNEAATFNNPLQQLDDAIVANETATNQPANGGRYSAEGTTLVITTDTITRTQNRHVIDTEGAAAADNLATISGGIDGLRMTLRIANSARVVTVKHNTGNILLANGTDLVLNDVNMVVDLMYSSTFGKWVEIGDGYAMVREILTSTLVPANQLTVPDRTLIGSTVRQRRLAIMPSYEVSNRWEVRAAAAILQPIGIAALTNAATTVLSASNQTDSTYVNVASGAVSGNCAGFGSTTFDLVRRQYNPTFEWIWTSGAAADIANIRLWMGLFQQAPTSADTLAASTAAMAFRLTTGTDSFFMGVNNDGASQATPVSTGVALAAATRYKFRIRVDSANALVWFSVNDSTEVSVATNLPATTQNLGFNLYYFTTAAVAKNWLFSRAVCMFS